MKKIIGVFCLATAFFLLSLPSFGQTAKDKWRFNHIVKELKMSKDLAAKFQPVFYSYMKELHAAKDIYDDVKDKYQIQINKKTLTAQQAHELLNAHWNSDAQEVVVRRKYTPIFCKIIKENYVYYIFKLANDKP